MMTVAQGMHFYKTCSPYENYLPIHLILIGEPFFLFSKLKGIIKETGFESVDAIKTKKNELLCWENYVVSCLELK